MLVIGDVHGQTFWEPLAEKYFKENPLGHVVFLGDYFDSIDVHRDVITKNAYNIFNFAENNKDNVHLLIGNHDYHYMSYCKSRYSGYNSKAAYKYRSLLDNYGYLLQPILMVETVSENYLLSHAGVTKTWLMDNDISYVSEIFDLYKQNPNAFDFQYKPNADPYGNDHFQGPLWVRPDALVEDHVEGYSQIVGHTRSANYNLKDGHKLFVICDRDPEKNYFIFK